MVFPGLLESGFMISVGVSLLLAGLIVYYVRGQLSVISDTVNKQQSVLSEFIKNIKESTNAITRDGLANVVNPVCVEKADSDDHFSDTASELSADEEEPVSQSEKVSLSVTGIDSLYNGCPGESAAIVTVQDLVDENCEAGCSSSMSSNDLKKAKVGELRELAENKLSWDSSEIKKAKKAELIEALTQDSN